MVIFLLIEMLAEFLHLFIWKYFESSFCSIQSSGKYNLMLGTCTYIVAQSSTFHACLTGRQWVERKKEQQASSSPGTVSLCPSQTIICFPYKWISLPCCFSINQLHHILIHQHSQLESCLQSQSTHYFFSTPHEMLLLHSVSCPVYTPTFLMQEKTERW